MQRAAQWCKQHNVNVDGSMFSLPQSESDKHKLVRSGHLLTALRLYFSLDEVLL